MRKTGVWDAFLASRGCQACECANRRKQAACCAIARGAVALGVGLLALYLFPPNRLIIPSAVGFVLDRSSAFQLL